MQTSSRLDLASLREGSLTLYGIYERGEVLPTYIGH